MSVAGDATAGNTALSSTAGGGNQSNIVGGATTTRSFDVGRINVGPVERFNLRVSVVEAGMLDHPLVGQAFFYGWQYTIDNAGRVIRFLRR